jgi:N utilization substance protein B
MGRRTRARECAVQMLYQWDLTQEPMEGVIESFWRVRSTVEETRRLAERLARGTRERIEEIDAAIAAALTHWRMDRLAAVDKCILRVATYELMAERETPAAVVLDEAIDMARRFGEADSPPFVNGVLDAVRRAVRGGSEVGGSPAGGGRRR